MAVSRQTAKTRTPVRRAKTVPKRNELELMGKPLKSAAQASITRLAILIWSLAGHGKTFLACTGPGRKLLINLDPDGPKSVSEREDVEVLDLSSESTDEVLRMLRSTIDPLGLNKFLDTHPEFETVILDSATMLARRGLERAVKDRLGAGKGFTPTMEAPGLGAYGGRNAILLDCLTGLLRVTGKHDRHLIVTAHEDVPTTDDHGNVLFISIMLGGKLVAHTSPTLSDIWWLNDTGRTRQVAIRRRAQRTPMKSRIYRQDGKDFFEFKDGDTTCIADIWDRYKKGGGKKMIVK